MINTQDYFETSDFPLAITLLCLGFFIENFDVTEPRRVKFMFSETEILLKKVNEYWGGQVLVDPQLFFNTQKNLKSRLSELSRTNY